MEKGVKKQPTSKILLVDDECNLLEILKAVLSSETIDIQIATTIQEACKAVEETKFDVVIADICLSGVRSREGLELIRFVREKSPETHIVSMTGYGTEEMEKECYESGANFYFNKPLDLKILINHLNEQGLMVEMLK